jgi:phospholipid/cholesterol/gamma-HCH transport system substrate-binding protein
MDERLVRFRVGVVVLTAACITLLLVFLFSAERSLFRRSYNVIVRFPSAPGVADRTPVRKSGIQIGRVYDVELLDDGGVRLTLRIDRGRKLLRREYARIGTPSLVTGDSNLEFILRGDNDRTLIADFDSNGDGSLSSQELAVADQEVQDGDFLGDGRVARDPMEALASVEERLGGAFVAVQDASYRISRLVDNLNSMLNNNDDQFRRILDQTETAIGNFDQTARNVNEVFGDAETRKDLKVAIGKLPQLVDGMELAVNDARETMQSFKSAGKRADNVLASVEQIVEPLAERGEEFAENLVGITGKLDSFLLELNVVGEMLARGDGTIAKLLREDDIYKSLSDSVARFERMSRQLEPVMHDVRIAADKVARDPSIILKNVLKKKPSGAYLKNGMEFPDTQGYFPRAIDEDRRRSNR